MTQHKILMGGGGGGIVDGADTSPTSLIFDFVDLHCCCPNNRIGHKGIRALNGYETGLVSCRVRTVVIVELTLPKRHSSDDVGVSCGSSGKNRYVGVSCGSSGKNRYVGVSCGSSGKNCYVGVSCGSSGKNCYVGVSCGS
jgi:hypothetical protein